MPDRLIHIILNPTSRAGRAGRLHDQIVRELHAHGIEAAFYLTKERRHATEIARQLASAGAEIVAAAGGDGTVHEVANGILHAGTATALAVIPLGTGNDFAKVVPGAASRADALRTLVKPRIRAYDVGHARWQGGEEFFINGMGTGIDVEVVRQISRLPHMPGAVKYLLGLLRALVIYDPVSITARFDGETLDRSVMMMAVGNGRCQGGGFYLTPQAEPDDGRLELCVVEEIPLWKVPLVLPLVLRGTHARHSAVTMRSFRKVRFEADGAAPLYFQLDGELHEPPQASWLDVEIRPGALNVVTAGEATTVDRNT